MPTRAEIAQTIGLRLKYELNPLQQAVYPIAVLSENNLLVASGTGTGKTVCYELGMWKCLKEGKQVIVIAPSKALIEQKADAWTEIDSPFVQFPLVKKTGDYSTQNNDLAMGAIKLCTPEALAVALRSNRDFLNNAGLLVVDEIHTIGTEGRGNAIEAVIVEIFSHKPTCRFMGFSATINDLALTELGTWINKLSAREVSVVKSAWRQCEQVWHIHLYEDSSNYRKNEEKKQQLIIDLLATINDKTLVFAHTKKFGKDLVAALANRGISTEWHCADVPKDKRRNIERMFQDGAIRGLVATSTLAVGCDFPVENVLIAGVHRGPEIVEQEMLQQMAGRAGHQFPCTVGNVHILVPSNKEGLPKTVETWEQFLKKEYFLISELQEIKWAAFHFIGVINHARQATNEILWDWYEKTLGQIQVPKPISFVEKVINYLINFCAIEQVFPNTYETTNLGKTANYFYFSPEQVYFMFKFAKTLNKNNVLATSCLVFSQAFNPYELQTAIKEFGVSYEVKKEFKDILLQTLAPEIFAEFQDEPIRLIIPEFLYALTKIRQDMREELPAYGILAGIIIKDLDRILAATSYFCGKIDFLKHIIKWLEISTTKIKYGIEDNLIDLISIQGIGIKRCIKLSEAGIKNPQQIIEKQQLVFDVLGEKTGQKVIDSSKVYMQQQEKTVISVPKIEEEIPF